VERNYHVLANADNRAIAGLSMGGGQALSIGLMHPELFHYVLGFSAAIGGQFLNIDETIRPLLANPAAANAKFRLLWISVGRQDFLFGPDQQLAKTLTDGGVKNTYRETEGAHVWSVWRNNLNEAATLLFRTGSH
jgi:enterochelin esterase family protein